MSTYIYCSSQAQGSEPFREPSFLNYQILIIILTNSVIDITERYLPSNLDD